MKPRIGLTIAVTCLSLLGVAGPTLGAPPTCVAVIGMDGLEVGESAEITGDIASKATVTVGKAAKITHPGGTTVSGDVVVLREWAKVDGNVRANDVMLGHDAIITGSVLGPPLPLPPLPTVSVTPGTTVVFVPKGGTQILAPGSYFSITTQESAEIHFTGGTYEMAEMRIGKATKLVFEGPTTVNVRDSLELGESFRITASAGVNPQFNYEGMAVARLGKGGQGALVLTAPTALIEVAEGGVYTEGSGFFGQRVRVGKGVRINGCSVVPPGSCQPTSSLTVLVSGTNVTAYVPKGSWSVTSTTGVAVANVEGSSIVPTVIPTAETVNSCAANFFTGQIVCTGNGTDVYLISGTSLGSTLTSGGSGSILFSGGSCTTCGVAMDAVHNKAVIALSLGGVGGYQFLNLSGVPAFEPPFTSKAPTSFGANISEDILIDPDRNLILSPNESNNFELVGVTTTTSPQFFEQAIAGVEGELDSAGEDCSTGIALAPAEFSGPSQVYIADLTQATFVPGTPGSWSSGAGAQVQTLTESFLSAGASGIAVAQGTFTGIVTGEFGGNAITAIALPTTSGSGTPAIPDWVTCNIAGFSNGFDPHTVTAYKSPSGGHAIAVLANGSATALAVVDLTKMLDPTIVPRTVGGHACAAGTLPATVASFVALP